MRQTDAAADESAWRAAVARVLKSAPPDSLTTHTRDGIHLAPLYAKAEAPWPIVWRDVSKPVAILQRAEHPDPAEAHRLARADIEGGAGGLTVVLAGALGSRGFGIDAAAPDALAAVVDDLPLDGLTLRLEPARSSDILRPGVTVGSSIDPLSGLAECKGGASISFELGLDPVGEFARNPSTSGRDTAEPLAVLAGLSVGIGSLRARGFTGSLLRADGRSYHEAGATEAQELASVLATGVTYLRGLEPLGPEEARETIAFTLVADADQVLTIAKLRALRRLWTRVEQACALEPKPIRLHVETAWRMLTRRDPHTDLLRNATASAAAILGGADSLTVLPHTSALGLPDAFARRLARNTPLVLIREAHLAHVADPAAGAGAIEAATDALCDEAWRLFQEIERAGGLPRMLRAGTWQARISDARIARQQDLASRRAVIVGVTRFATDGARADGRPEQDYAGERAGVLLPSVRDSEAFEAAQ